MTGSDAGDSRGGPSNSNTGRPGEPGLADQLSTLARTLESEDDVEATLDAIVHAAVTTVPGVQHASISSVQRRREVQTRAATGELSRAVDRLQYEAAQGPCLDTLYEQQTVRVADMAAEQRWPDFAKRASDVGVGSMLAVQLYVDGDDLGALNFISEHVDAFDDESEEVALMFASHAAVAMAGAQQQEHLRTAIQTRDVIGQAKGILMERFTITSGEAFALLVRTSQATNRRLLELAEDLIRNGELPAVPSDRKGSATG